MLKCAINKSKMSETNAFFSITAGCYHILFRAKTAHCIEVIEIRLQEPRFDVPLKMPSEFDWTLYWLLLQ